MYGAEFTSFLFVISVFILYFHHIKFKNIFDYTLFQKGESSLKWPYSRISQIDFWLTILQYKIFSTLEPLAWHRNAFSMSFFYSMKVLGEHSTKVFGTSFYVHSFSVFSSLPFLIKTDCFVLFMILVILLFSKSDNDIIFECSHF